VLPATALPNASQVYAQAMYALTNTPQARICAAITKGLIQPVRLQTTGVRQEHITQRSPALQHRHLLPAKQQILPIIVQYVVTVQVDLTPAVQQHAEQRMAVQVVMYVMVREPVQEIV